METDSISQVSVVSSQLRRRLSLQAEKNCLDGRKAPAELEIIGRMISHRSSIALAGTWRARRRFLLDSVSESRAEFRDRHAP